MWSPNNSFLILPLIYWFQAIFSDDSEDEVADAGPTSNQAPDPVKSSEGANKTLNRLVAGDFLQSLGMELGLEVPPDNRPGPPLNASPISPPEQRESPKGDDRNNTALTEVEDTKSKDYGSTVDYSREKKRSHSRHRRRRSRTPDSDSDSGSDSNSDSDGGHRSRSKRRRDRRDRSRNRDNESSDEASLYRKERRKKHRSRKHHEHKRKDYGDKHTDKKRRS